MGPRVRGYVHVLNQNLSRRDVVVRLPRLPPAIPPSVGVHHSHLRWRTRAVSLLHRRAVFFSTREARARCAFPDFERASLPRVTRVSMLIQPRFPQPFQRGKRGTPRTRHSHAGEPRSASPRASGATGCPRVANAREQKQEHVSRLFFLRKVFLAKFLQLFRDVLFKKHPSVDSHNSSGATAGTRLFKNTTRRTSRVCLQF